MPHFGILLSKSILSFNNVFSLTYILYIILSCENTVLQGGPQYILDAQITEEPGSPISNGRSEYRKCARWRQVGGGAGGHLDTFHFCVPNNVPPSLILCLQPLLLKIMEIRNGQDPCRPLFHCPGR